MLPLAACNAAGINSFQLAHQTNTSAGLPATPVSAPKAKHAARYFIEFRSRHSNTYGHTFVVFGRLNAQGQVGKIKPEMVAGLSPKGESSTRWAVGHLIPVVAETAWSDGDLEDAYVTNRFRVLLSRAEYVKLVAHIRHKQANSPLWHLAIYNCNLWTGEIAEYVGLRTGSSWMMPANYIQTMKELNTPNRL